MSILSDVKGWIKGKLGNVLGGIVYWSLFSAIIVGVVVCVILCTGTTECEDICKHHEDRGETASYFECLQQCKR